MRGMREDRREMDASPDLPAMWCDFVLRQFAEQTRKQTCTRGRSSRDRLCAGERALDVLLSRRRVLRVVKGGPMIGLNSQGFAGLPSEKKSLCALP